MSVQFRRTLTTPVTISASAIASYVTTGNYYLRKFPYSANTYTGTHIANGSWDFGTVEDGYYQIWNASSQIASYGTFWIGDKDPTLTTLEVTGDVSLSGQVGFYNSTNFNSNDIAHVDNLQVHTLSENNSGSGITFSHKITISDSLREQSNLASLTSNNYYGNSLNRFILNPEYIGSSTPSTSGLIPFYFANATYGRLITTNNWSGQNIYTTFVPQCSIAPTVGSHFTNKTYVDTTVNNAVLSANLSSLSSLYLNQVSPNVIRLIADGVNSTTNKVATSWSLAMKQAKQSITSSGSSATIQQIISIEGIGQTGTSLPINNLEIGTYFYPKVHVKGISQSVKLSIDDAAMDSGGSALGSIVEDVTIYHDDGGLGATPTFANLTFKDVVFDMKVDSLTLSNCIFRGTNIFNMKTGTLYLNSITGTTYYSTVPATTTGICPSQIVSTNLN